MSRICHNRRPVLAITALGALAATGVLSQPAPAGEASVQAATADVIQTPNIDARSALQTAIALGYPDIRRSGLAGDLYLVEAVDANGDAVHLYLDPDSGFVMRIEKE